MLRNFFTLIVLGFAGLSLSAQTPIPNGDFEAWSADGLNLFEEPSSGWWATLNPLRQLGGPVTVARSSDAHGGSYSAVLTTSQYGTLLVPGILLSGGFDLLAAPNYFTRGQPYTDRPDRFQGWYKFAPANGDSAAIAVQLMRWNSQTSQRDTIGEVGLVIRQAVNSWTQFDLPILYFSTDQPDSIIVVATSSADGANFNGQPGSKLWVDDLSMQTATRTTQPQTRLGQVRTLPAGGWQIDLEVPRARLEIRDLSGRVLRSESLLRGSHRLSDPAWAEGVYFLYLRSPKGEYMVEKTVLRRP